MLIVGAGGAARDLLAMLELEAEMPQLVFYDDVRKDAPDEFCGYPLLKNSESARQYFAETDKRFCVAVGGPHIRRELGERMEALGGQWTSLVSSKATISSDCSISQRGVIVMHGCVMTRGVEISDGCLINMNCTLGHGCRIGAHSELAPGVYASQTEIGEGTFLGINAVVIPRVNIGRNCVIGAASVVTRSVGDGMKLMGNPARQVLDQGSLKHLQGPAVQEGRKELLVSVLVLTYNHAGYIRQCLESILEQVCDFQLEIIIADDHSNDGSREIIEEFINQHPGLIRTYPTTANQGVFMNFASGLQLCQGSYIALTEGDDYWNYPGKLQEQIDFLESEPAYNGCFHDTAILRESGDANAPAKAAYATYAQFNQYQFDFQPWHLIQRNVIPTSSLVVRRRNLWNELVDFNWVELSLSWLYELLVIQESKFRYLPEIWSTHRSHPNGLTSTVANHKFHDSVIRMLRQLMRHPVYKHQRAEICLELLKEYKLLFYSDIAAGRKWKIAFGFPLLGLQYGFYQAIEQFTQINRRDS